MEVELQIRRQVSKLFQKHLHKTQIISQAKTLLDVLGCSGTELSILVTDDKEIKQLNKAYRYKDKATDVLSFPQLNLSKVQKKYSSRELKDVFTELTGPLGDIVISLETTIKQAEKYEVSVAEEFVRLLVHGTLHLLGYDHENVTSNFAKKMRDKERRLRAHLNKNLL